MIIQDEEVPADKINTISAKLFGLAELIMFQNGEPSLEQQRANYGIGLILSGLSEELREVDVLLKAATRNK